MKLFLYFGWMLQYEILKTKNQLSCLSIIKTCPNILVFGINLIKFIKKSKTLKNRLQIADPFRVWAFYILHFKLFSSRKSAQILAYILKSLNWIFLKIINYSMIILNRRIGKYSLFILARSSIFRKIRNHTRTFIRIFIFIKKSKNTFIIL